VLRRLADSEQSEWPLLQYKLFGIDSGGDRFYEMADEKLVQRGASPLVFELPFGRVGAAISRDAFYAPFVQRMEDLGAELVAQPEAWTDGWMREDAQGGWLPDVILSSGWSHTQKYRGLTANATPMLHGNLFDLLFDGQVWLTRKGTPDEVPRGFVGSLPLRGWRELGPWAMEDPGVSEPGLSLEERRARLLEEGRALLPGGRKAGEYRRALVGADLFFHGDTRAAPALPVTPGTGLASSEVAPAERGHQGNVEAAVDGVGHVYAVFSDTRTGRPQVMLTVSEDGGAHWREAVPVAPSLDRQLRPTVAAHGAGRVVVGWQEETAGHAARVRVAASGDGGRNFSTVDVEPTGLGQWEPRLAFRPDGEIDDTVSELEGKGVEFAAGGISEHPWGRVATFKDPDGNDLQLYAPPK